MNSRFGRAAFVAALVTLPAHFALADGKPTPAPSDSTPTPAPAPPEPEASVQDVSMMIDAQINGKDAWSPGGREMQWSGAKCPYKISFKGVVQVDRPTKVTYRWERSNGEKDEGSFDVKKAGEPVEIAPAQSWPVGKPGQQFRGVMTFHVLTPTDLSTSTPIRVDCQ